MKRFAIIAAAIAMAIGTAQAQVPPSASSTQPSARHAGLIGALKGGAIGCLAGGILGRLTHHSMLKSCAVGGAAGAVIGGVRAYKAQVKEARALADQARAAGATASMQTQTVQAKADDGSQQQTEALKALHIGFQPEQVADKDPSTQAVLAKAAALAKSSDGPVTLRVAGTSAQRAWIAEQLQSDLGDAQHVTVAEAYGPSPSLDVITGSADNTVDARGVI